MSIVGLICGVVVLVTKGPYGLGLAMVIINGFGMGINLIIIFAKPLKRFCESVLMSEWFVGIFVWIYKNSISLVLLMVGILIVVATDATNNIISYHNLGIWIVVANLLNIILGCNTVPIDPTDK